MSQLIALECDHCGGTAITSLYGQFSEDQGERCDTCGMPGGVTLSQFYNDEDEECTSASWLSRLEVGDYCNEPSCVDCAEARKELAAMTEGEAPWDDEDARLAGTLPRNPESKLRRQVRAFHKAFSVPVLTRPQIPPDDRVRLRLRLVAEEFCELLQACTNEYDYPAQEAISRAHDIVFGVINYSPLSVNLPDVADALGDLDYVIEGTRLEFGINGEPIADEIQRSNMAKVGGPVLPGGKVGKPEGWTPPDIAGELKKQGWSVE